MTTATHSSYMAALAADDLFVDHTYQRDLDMGRAKKMAAGWDQRLAGALEVSDRGHPIGGQPYLIALRPAEVVR